MANLPLSALLTTQVVTVVPETPLAEVLALMEEHRISCIVALDADGRPAGIFTEQDVIRLMADKLSGQSLRLADAIEVPPFTVPIDIDYREAYQRMACKGYRHLLVVDADGRLNGVVSESDFLRHLSMEYLVEHKPVRSVMNWNVSVLTEQATLADAVSVMSRHRFGCMLITRDGVPVGIITERDMVHLARTLVDPEHVPIVEVMHSPVHSVSADCFVQEAAKRMQDLKIRRLAVVTDSGELVGLVTRHDIVKTLQGRYIEFLHETIALKNKELDYKQQQLDLQEQKLLYLTMMEQIDDAIFVVDAETGKILDANAQACCSLGYEREALLQCNVRDISSAVAEYPNMEEFRAHLEQCKGQALQTFHRRSDGSRFPAEVKVRTINRENRVYLVAVARDLTLIQQQERQLSLLRKALKACANAVMITDTAAVVEWANPAFCRLTGYSLEDAVGKTIKELVYSGVQSREFYSNLWQTILSGHVWHGEIVNKNKDGMLYTEEMTITPVYGEHGKIEHFIAIKEDITERKRLEKSFFENERFLNTIIESEPECVKVIDKGYRLLRTNRAGLNMIETDSYEQVIGKNLLDLVIQKYREPLVATAQRVFAGEQAEMEYEIVGLKGTRRWLATNAVPLRDEKGEITAALGITRDITAHKLAELRILNLNRVYTMLSNINQAIIRIREPAALYREACRIAVENGGFRMGWVGLLDPAGNVLRPVACAGYYGDYLQDMQIALHDEMQVRNPVVRAYHEGRHVCCNDIQSDEDVQLWQEQLALQLGYRSLIALPLKVKGAMRGVFTLYSAQTNFFTPEEIQLLDELADDISFGMEVAEADAERSQAEAHLRQAAAVFESTREGVMITDAEQNILMVNRAFTELTGHSENEIIGQKPVILQSGRHDRNFYTALWLSIEVTGHWQGEIWNRRKNGEVYPELLSISSVTNQDGVLTGYVGVFADISKLKASEAELEFLAHHDPLTRLPNRLLLLSRLEHGMQIARREGRQLALLMLDLDRFKDVNDSFGHLAGDELLQQVADRLTSRLRGVDTVSRLGGDEFTVLLENITHAEDAARVADAIIADLNDPWRLSHGGEVRIGVSVGISLFPQHGKTAEQLLQHADAALYQAKAEGRGRFKYFSDALTRAARERIGLEARLRRAIVQNELRVFYQPRVDIATGCITGAEALLRWQNPEEGLILPARFIPVAEATGQIGAIGEWVLRETCFQGRRWIDAGIEPLVLAVNVSAYQFLSGDMPAMVADILSVTGFPAVHLELEVTESALMEREKEVTEKLNLLRAIGVRIAIDDFGTGYSSLAYLKHFPLDVLKIDKSFISDIPDNKDDMQIAAAIVAMAHTLRVKVLAEGVETEEQLAFLRSQGCDFYQGYLKSPPLPAEAFEELLISCKCA